MAGKPIRPPTIEPEGHAIHAMLKANWKLLDDLHGTDQYPDRWIDHTETRRLLAAWLNGERSIHLRWDVRRAA